MRTHSRGRSEADTIHWGICYAKIQSFRCTMQREAIASCDWCAIDAGMDNRTVRFGVRFCVHFCVQFCVQFCVRLVCDLCAFVEVPNPAGRSFVCHGLCGGSPCHSPHATLQLNRRGCVSNSQEPGVKRHHGRISSVTHGAIGGE